jgi:AGZA family xanthine/uracil permease-like MFS transporter
MLSNFIATSISLKKQEIGILRAIGSRSNDVFRIFFAEAFIIAMINFFLAIVSTGVVAGVINSILRDDIGILITMLIGIPMGVTEFKGLVSHPESISSICCKFEWDHIFSIDMLIIVFTFFFIDMFDTVGTLIGVCTKSHMVDENGNIRRLKQAFMADAIATTVGAILGTSTTTTYVESAAGVAQGGRSGLTAFSIACCFAVALFFSPLFLSIPAAATAPALIIVGLLMMTPITQIPFDDFSEAVPAFVCIVMMPFSYSISNGILLGMISYVLMNMICGNFKKLTPAMYILAVLFILKYIFI